LPRADAHFQAHFANQQPEIINHQSDGGSTIRRKWMSVSEKLGFNSPGFRSSRDARGSARLVHVSLEDELMETLDFEDSPVTVFVMEFGTVVEAGEFLALPGGGGGGQGVRVGGGAVGDVRLDFLKALSARGLVALGAVGGAELAGLPGIELAPGFDFST
jgi:hypothetical protein